MANIDEKVFRELEKETEAVSELLAKEGGLPDMVSAAFKGSMRRWVWATSVITLIATGFMVWTGYEFFTASLADDRMYWGICMILSVMVQVALKQWQWMEMNRASLMREIKRLEIAVAVLAKHAD